MYCPNCATKSSLDQKFCRACGFGLEKTAQAVSEQLPTKLAENLNERKERLEKLGVIALSIFGVGLLSFFLYMVGYKLMLSQGRIVAGLAILGIFIVLGSGLLSVVLFAKATELKEASSKRRLQEPDEIAGTGATGKLLTESHHQPLPSVTERTTELLPLERKKSAD